MNFYETKMGQKFFCCQVPALIEALQSIAKVKASSAVIIPPLEDSKEGTDILFDLFYGNYQRSNKQWTLFSTRFLKTPILFFANMRARQMHAAVAL